MKNLFIIGVVLLFQVSTFAMNNSTIQKKQCGAQQLKTALPATFFVDVFGITFRARLLNTVDSISSTSFYRLEPCCDIDSLKFDPITFRISSLNGMYEFQPVWVKNGEKLLCPLDDYQNIYGYDYCMREIIQEGPTEIIEIDSSDESDVVEQENLQVAAKEFNPIIIVDDDDAPTSIQKEVVEDGSITLMDYSKCDFFQRKLKMQQEEKEQEKKTKQEVVKNIVLPKITKKRRTNLYKIEKIKKSSNKKKYNAWDEADVFTWNDGFKQNVYKDLDITKQDRPVDMSFDDCIKAVCKDENDKNLEESNLKIMQERFGDAFEIFRKDNKKIEEFFACLSRGSVDALVTFFVDNNIFKPHKKYPVEENLENVLTTCDMHKMLLEILVYKYVAKESLHNLFWFNSAVKLFKIFFDSRKAFIAFNKAVLALPGNHSFARICSSIIYSCLTLSGWKHWRKETLELLKSEYKKGNKVVYLGGGCDVSALIKHGIYDICVIDPLMQEQAPFYTNGWKHLVEGNVGDTIKILVKDDYVVLKRIQQHKNNTIWAIQSKNKKRLGLCEFQRRFCSKADFCITRDKKPVNEVLLLSFNEAYHLGLEKRDGGWGININTISHKKKIFVKQLGSINLDVLGNIKCFEYHPLFKFISLGASPSNSENMK